VSSSSYKDLHDALSLHQNLIYAEQQAISSKDLDSVESILIQKEKSLDLLLDVKKKYTTPYPPEIDSWVREVLLQQDKNAENFRKLHIQQPKKADGGHTNESPLFRRMRQAYKQ